MHDHSDQEKVSTSINFRIGLQLGYFSELPRVVVTLSSVKKSSLWMSTKLGSILWQISKYASRRRSSKIRVRWRNDDVYIEVSFAFWRNDANNDIPKDNVNGEMGNVQFRAEWVGNDWWDCYTAGVLKSFLYVYSLVFFNVWRRSPCLSPNCSLPFLPPEVAVRSIILENVIFNLLQVSFATFFS